MSKNDSELDPRTANATFCWDDLGDGCVGRVYYWYDPTGHPPAIDDWDFHPMHPEISDREWERLFYEAFELGENRFSAAYRSSDAPSDTLALVSRLGRLFGPRPPREAC